jgi:hypothetical protein
MARGGPWPSRWPGVGSACSLRACGRRGSRLGVARGVHASGTAGWSRWPGSDCWRAGASWKREHSQREQSSRRKRPARPSQRARRSRRQGRRWWAGVGPSLRGTGLQSEPRRRGTPPQGFRGAESAGRIGCVVARDRHGEQVVRGRCAPRVQKPPAHGIGRSPGSLQGPSCLRSARQTIQRA